MNIRSIIQDHTAQAMNSLYGAKISPQEVQVQETRPEFTGEFTVVVFPLARQSKKNPQQTAEELGTALQQSMQELESFEIVKGFLNLKLKDSFWNSFLYSLNELEPDEWQKTATPLNIMLEYSSPNTNKPLHLGHVRNNLLGYSVAEILKARGHEVIKANLTNDRGIHICKSMLAWLRFGNGETPESSGIKGDHLVGKYYVEFDKVYKLQVAELMMGGMPEKEAKKKAPFMIEAQELLRKWEANDPDTIDVWKMMNDWVYAGFAETYKTLGVDFDRMYYESQTYLLGKGLVLEGLQNGVFTRDEDGSVWIDLTDEGLDRKLVLRGDGTSVYITQDLGTASQRFEEYDLDRLIYTVGNEQDYHFKVLQLILKKMGREWHSALYHLSYGMVELPDGKMKSREGTAVDADDLVADMILEAGNMTADSGKASDMTEEEKQELYRIVALAALKFFILKADPKKAMLFNPQESIDIQGFTGPYIQYTYARIRSILRRIGEAERMDGLMSENKDVALHKEEKEVLRYLIKKDDTLHAAEENLSPALLANYAYELAKEYNQFYHAHNILKEEDAQRRHFYLLLSAKTAHCLMQVCALLGMEMPERM